MLFGVLFPAGVLFLTVRWNKREDMPKVSIISGIYNCENTLPEAMESKVFEADDSGITPIPKESPAPLELKVLPSYLEYTHLGPDSTLLVIISSIKSSS